MASRDQSAFGGQRLQTTHLWMELTKGNQSADGGEHNLQLVANLLCDIARYDLPYPRVSGEDRLKQLMSAVGDSSGTSGTAFGVALSRPLGSGDSSGTSGSAVGDSSGTSGTAVGDASGTSGTAAAAGRTGESSSDGGGRTRLHARRREPAASASSS